MEEAQAENDDVDQQVQNVAAEDAVDIDGQLENVESQAETRITGKSVID